MHYEYEQKIYTCSIDHESYSLIDDRVFYAGAGGSRIGRGRS